MYFQRNEGSQRVNQHICRVAFCSLSTVTAAARCQWRCILFKKSQINKMTLSLACMLEYR